MTIDARPASGAGLRHPARAGQRRGLASVAGSLAARARRHHSSRTLVLFDGVPINDPYGGWIYWAKAPREIVDRVEVVRGGGASIWGNLALGGVINLMTIEPSGRSITASALQGDHHTNDISLALADAGSKWSGWISGDDFDTDGYHVVREDLLGPIDEPTAKQYESYLGKGSYAPSPRVSLHLSADSWDEERQRGSPLDRGSAEAWSAVGNASIASAVDTWDFHLFTRHQDWLNFSVRAPPTAPARRRRTTSSINPRTCWGRTPPGRDDVGERHRLLAGADLQRIDLEHHQDLDLPQRPVHRALRTSKVASTSPALSSRTSSIRRRAWSIQAGARFDQISNYDGPVLNSDPATAS